MLAALDGEVSRKLRALVPLDSRRKEGAFFTSRTLADRLLPDGSVLVGSYEVMADPACGAGDLLLSIARSLPVADTVVDTLRLWGDRLIGRDLNTLYIRATHLRLALLASARVGRAWHVDEALLGELLHGISVGDGMQLELDKPTLMLLNPPFGLTAAQETWATGRVARAAVFTAKVVERLHKQATLRAILPDVLRSGTNYRRWRDHLQGHLQLDRIEPIGQFDQWTDVDVFLLGGSTSEKTTQAAWWSAPKEQEFTQLVGELFEVRVGTVVPHRDPIEGPDSPYLTAHDLPLKGECRPGAVRLRHEGRRFGSPLVAVRRTSRPQANRSRLTATVVRAAEPVLAENHLIVCMPNDRTLKSCRRLVAALTDARTTEWLDQRLRCRHLTVSALRAVPMWQ